MIIETKMTLKLTANEVQILEDCQDLLTRIATQADEIGGEFDEILTGNIDDALDTLMTLKDMSDIYFGV